MKFLLAVFTVAVLVLPSHSYEYYTPWLSRDYPSGTGDWELYQAFKPTPCRSGYSPVSAECRVRYGRTPWYKTCENIPSGCTAKGFVCQNKHQSDRSCLNYEIRFLCYKKNC